ncbi:RWD domain-containing protein 3 isoform X2 [Lacerta agilis]|uniref:RWD domain-containing protein 3 isoform X2 n=1 Tax=Lacerta agilis TaxID=80427 RepID=UPI0014197753|nr:RWD domain-containing protein 3 isoform X2 [Lacerta agilis]
MSDLALEELSAIAAIYCGENECEVLEVSETEGISFRIQTSAKGPLGADILLKLLFHLPIGYPSSLPNISVSSEQLTRTQCAAVKGRLLEEAKRHFSQPMVHELILWIQQNLKHTVKQAETSVCSGESTLSTDGPEEDGVWIALLRLDHMRAKGKYVKTVEKWCADLKLTGRLMFMGKMILILLQGDRGSIKEYLLLQKTSKVDVDSSGKKCKEKMISVLSETKAQAAHIRFQAFEVKEYSTLGELQNEFKAAGLAELFSEFVLARLK